uniref:NADH-ubiquinone oxidoreductase chain 6 n=1 Tax=Elmidae sp. BMNH 840216 TaxID=904145 RepID=E3VT52_9COLE|nr:NADH dehydrogenase subunit 6 [Elmidae sp. BMNH 840216]
MISLLMILSISVSLTFLFLKHPMSMGLTLLIQSTLISMITGFYNHNFWFSYILFLIMIGGMLVLFIYMTSIASNEMFKYSNKLTIFVFTLIITLTIIMFNSDQLIMNQNVFNIDSTIFNNPELFKLSLNKYLNFPSNIMLFFMIIYLFITLIAVVKITNISYGPMRQKH